MDRVKSALETEIGIHKCVNWTDSLVAYFWIKQESHNWKQFVQNRVDEIRSLTPVESWRHCPGKDNPADIPSRG